jgi:hypothetical protein
MTTTIEQRIAAIQARAAARGLVARYQRRPSSTPRRSIPRSCDHPSPVPRPLAPQTATEKLHAATLRPLPNAWRQCTGRDSDDRDRRSMISTLELELAARLIARCLGPAWTVDRGDCRGRMYLRHIPTAARIFLAVSWNDDNRLRACPDHRHGHSHLPSEITFTREKSPAAMARDIERRLLHAGLIDDNARRRQSKRNDRDEEIGRLRARDAVQRILGGERSLKQHTKRRHAYHGDPCCRSSRDRAGTFDFQTDSYHGYKIEVFTHNLDLAELLAATFRQYADQQ